MRECREIRGHQGPRAVQALRFVGFRDVLLHLWRLFRTLSAWEIAGGDLWKDAFRCYLSRNFAGDGCGHGNSESDAVSVTRPPCRSESLDEYRVRRGIQRDHGSGDQGWLALLCPFRMDRNHPDDNYRLLCMDLAETANSLIAVTVQKAPCCLWFLPGASSEPMDAHSLGKSSAARVIVIRLVFIVLILTLALGIIVWRAPIWVGAEITL